MPLGEGWYIDLATGESISVDEHAYDVMHEPQKFRIDPKEITDLPPTAPADRDRIRRLALKRGFARVRSHGNSVVVEFDYPKLEDAVSMVIPFLTNNLGSQTWVAFHDITRKKQYADITVRELEDQDRVNEIFGLVYERKKIKLSSLYEDYDITPVGSKKYAAGTEKLVRGPKSGAGPGVMPPERGDLSRISDVGSEPYSKGTVGPSEEPRKGRRNRHKPL